MLFLWDLESNTPAPFFHALIFQTINFKNSGKTKKTFEVENLSVMFFSIPLTVTSSERRREKVFFISKFALYDKKSSRDQIVCPI